MIKMAEAQARAMPWPFATPRRSIGDLIDHGLLSADDLRRAARIAYSRKLKAACIALLEVLEKPTRPAPSLAKASPPIQSPTYPETCPICGGAVRPDHRWNSARHGAGWRCEHSGAAHCLQLRYRDMLKAVFAPDWWVIPPSGEYVGVRRCDLSPGPIGYWPPADH